MATADEVNAAVSEVANEEKKDGRGRQPQFDWAESEGIKDKTLQADQLDAYWEYCRKAEKADDMPSAKALGEILFANVVEYWKYRKQFYQYKLDAKLRAFERSQSSLKAKIQEATDFLSTYETLGADVAVQKAKVDALRRKFEAEQAKLLAAGYIDEDIDEEEEEEEEED